MSTIELALVGFGGLVSYGFATNQKIARVGEIVFACALLAIFLRGRF